MVDRVAKDPRFETLPCTHKGTYADDCIVDRVTRVSTQLSLFIILLNQAHDVFSGIDEISMMCSTSATLWLHAIVT